MSEKFKAPRGTFDVLPEQQPVRERIEDVSPPDARGAPATGGSRPRSSRTPSCSRGASASPPTSSRSRCSPSRTRAGARSPCGRRGPRSVCRAYLEHGMQKLAQPVKLWYGRARSSATSAPRPGATASSPRSDAEAIGSDSPLGRRRADHAAASDILAELGVEGVRLRLGSLGTPGDAGRLPRGAPRLPARARGRALQRGARRGSSQPAARLRRGRRGHPQGDGGRADDARPASTRRTPSTSPRSGRLLDRNGVAYDLDPTLVRGLDYYTRTVFEFECDRLGAQSGIGGGGRYDGLIEQLGGPPTPGLGWAARGRADRARAAARRRARRQTRDGVFVVAGDDAPRPRPRSGDRAAPGGHHAPTSIWPAARPRAR